MKGDPIYIKQILRAYNPTANVGIRLVQPKKREVVGPVSGDPTCVGSGFELLLMGLGDVDGSGTNRESNLKQVVPRKGLDRPAKMR